MQKCTFIPITKKLKNISLLVERVESSPVVKGATFHQGATVAGHGAGRIKLRDEISFLKYFLLNTGISPGVNWVFTIFTKNTGYFSGCELSFLKIRLEIPGFSPGVNYNFHFSLNFAAFFILR